MMARTTAVAVASATLQCSKQKKWQQQEQCWQQHWKECANSNGEPKKH